MAVLPGPLFDDDNKLSLEECFANYNEDDRYNSRTCMEFDTSAESGSQLLGQERQKEDRRVQSGRSNYCLASSISSRDFHHYLLRSKPSLELP